MGRLNKVKGNMYSFVSHQWMPFKPFLCGFSCTYCYTKASYHNPIKEIILDKPFPNLGKGNTIFVAHMCDLFAPEISGTQKYEILNHCQLYPHNKYLFQTKNPQGIMDYIGMIPKNSIVGTTIETNKSTSGFSKAPDILHRLLWLGVLSEYFKIFITIEPIIQFDLEEMANLIITANPSFINIGADSKNHNLEEPPASKIMELITELKKNKIEVRLKPNLDRLMKEGDVQVDKCRICGSTEHFTSDHPSVMQLSGEAHPT